LDRALELGVTHLDTAAVYQDGENEKFVGACIKGRRDRVFLATKCGMERGPEGGIRADNRPETVRRSCDESLRLPENLISGERYPESMMKYVNV
jgi:aryl-alcohol dehydrogenase-like predicted oxidoreductase